MTMAETEKTEIERENSEVYCLDCAFCDSRVCNRAMKSFLVADEKMELFSTDEIDRSYIDLTDEKNHTENCRCLIQTMACLQCGNIIGYFVKLPCRQCLQSPNNGHYWMFNREAVVPSVRLNSQGSKFLQWDELPSYNQDILWDSWEECER